jgi:FixJ family two-component response regulator
VTRSTIIAIVDDDPGVRGSIVSLLRSADFESCAFATAEELLDSDDQDALACIVTDLHIPGMTGIALQQALIAAGWPQPLIAMTAFPTPAAREHMIAHGACAFLTKPIDPDALLDAIGAALQPTPHIQG